MNSRKKGLQSVNKVKKILQDRGEKVEGPGYKVIWLPSGPQVVHCDYFGLFDLLSIPPMGVIRGHAVCSMANKKRNAKKILDGDYFGDLWAEDEGKFNRYHVYRDIEGDHIELVEEGIK